MTGDIAPDCAVLGLDAAEWATIMIALAAATLPATLPLMAGVLARQFGIGTDLAGYVIAVNMGGLLAGSLSCIGLARKFSRRALIVNGLGVMVAGNALTLATTGLVPLIGARLVSGWGEGIVGAACYALMGQARLPARSIALYTAGQAIVGSASLALVPALMAAYGWHVFYIVVSVVAVPAWLGVGLATRQRGETISDRRGRTGLPVAGFAPLLSIFLYFAGIAMVWAFIERLGVLQNLTLMQLSVALSSSSMAGLAGSCLAGVLAHRLRVGVALGIGIALVTGSLALLRESGFHVYITAICGLSFAWAYQFPFLFERLAVRDRGGNIALLTPLATGGALTIGPAIGGFVLAHGGLSMLCGGCLAATAAGTAIAAASRPATLSEEVKS